MKRISLWLMLALSLVFYPIFIGQTFFFGDLYSLFVPAKIFLVNSLRDGSFPFWIFSIQSGTPFWADISHSIFSISTIFFLFLPTYLALNFSLFFSISIGALGAWTMSQKLKQSKFASLVAAVVWMLSHPVIYGLYNLTITQSLSFTPWMMAAVIEYVTSRSRSSAWKLAFFTSLSLLGGYPQIALYMSVACLAYLLINSKNNYASLFSDFFWPTILSLGILSPLIFPFLELAKASTRLQMSSAQVLMDSVPITHLIQWLVPNFWSNLHSGLAWGPSFGFTRPQPDGYIGLAGLLAISALIKNKKWNHDDKFFFFLACFGLLLAFGKNIPGMSWLLDQFGSLRFFRIPSTFLFFWSIGCSALIGKAIELWRPTTKWKYLLALAGLMLAILASSPLWFENLWSKLPLGTFHTIDRDILIFKNIAFHATFSVLGLAGIIYFRQIKLRLGIILVLFLDLWISAMPMLIYAPAKIYLTNSPQAEFLTNNLQNFRAVSLSGHLPWTGLQTYWDNISLRPPFAESRFSPTEKKDFSELIARQNNLAANWNIVYNVASPLGYSPFILQSSVDYWQATSEARINDLPALDLDSKQFYEQGVKYYLLDKKIHSEVEILKKYPNLNLVVQNEDWSILGATTSGIINSTVGEITNTRFSNNEIFFTNTASAESEVNIAVNYYPGWSCRTNNAECQIAMTASGMKIKTPVGQNNYVLSFKPNHWNWWILLSLISTAATSASLFRICYRK